MARQVVALMWDDGLLRLLSERAQVHVVIEDGDDLARADPRVVEAMASIYRVPAIADVEHLAMVAADLRVRGVDVTKVLSFNERSQYAGVVLAALVDASYKDARVVMSTRDKRVMKQRLRSAGVATADFVSLGRPQSVPSALEIVARLGLPCVVKPTSGMGCARTHVVRTTDALAAAVEAWAADPSEGHLIVESHQSGDELHIDAVWSKAAPIVFVVSRYLAPVVEVSVPGRNNGSHVVRREDEPELYNELERVHRELNAALGIVDGITHAEVFYGRQTPPVVSEVATRFGGTMIPEVVGLAVGQGLREIVIDVLLGAQVDSGMWRPASGTVGWTTLSPLHAGILANVDATYSKLLGHPSVLKVRAVKRDGDYLDPWLNPSQANVIDIVIQAPTPDDFRRKVAALAEAFPIEVVPRQASAEQAPDPAT